MKIISLKKIVIITFLVLVFFSPFYAKIGKSYSKVKGELPIYENYLKVIIQLKGEPVVLYRKTLTYSLLSIINKKNDSFYEGKLLNKQEELATFIENLGGSVSLNYTETINAIAALVPREKIKFIEENPNIEAIYPDVEAELERSYLTKTIHSDEVNKLKDSLGNLITGKNIVIGVVDTGVDYTHSELGGAKFPNSKVIGGYDFADNDPDPMDEEGHGTHVAGIIAGSKKGIAPDAKLRVYKVFTKTDSSTSTSLIIKGIDAAVKDKVDIINISIGTVGGLASGSDAQSVSVNNAITAGVIVVAAAGNKGVRSSGIEYPMSSPSSVENAISVGASDDGQTPVLSFNTQEIYGQYPSESPLFPEGTFELVYCGIGEKSNFAGKDLKGKIALIERGKIYFGDKDLNAKDAGAIGVIVYNNVSGMPKIQLLSQNNPSRIDFIPFIFISYSDGMMLRSSSVKKISITHKYGLGLISDFTSSGPTADFYLKPDLLAPGTNIESTYLNNGYYRLSGTSMASPAVAGACALIKQAKPNLLPLEIKALLMNTADILINPITQKPFPPYIQGAGRINLMSSINSDILSKTTSLIFGNGTKEKSFYISIKSFSNMNRNLSITVLFSSSDSLIVNSPSSVFIPAGKEGGFSITLKAEDAVIESYGYIYLKDSNINLHIPFLYMKDTAIRDSLFNSKISNIKINKDKSIDISFAIGQGIEIADNESTFIGNVAEEVRVGIYDLKGNLINYIFDKAPVYIGDYSIKVTPYSPSTNLLYLTNGKYYFRIDYLIANEDENSKLVYKTVVRESKSGSFEVEEIPNSFLEIKMGGNLSPYIRPNGNFTVIVNAKDVKLPKSYSFVLLFDHLKLNPLTVSISENLSKNSSLDYILSEGKLNISVNSQQDLPSYSGEVARISFNAIEEGETLLEIYSQDSSIVYKTLRCNISEYSQMYDINGDKIADKSDFDVISKNFGKKVEKGSEGSKVDFDFNGLINDLDLFIFSKHYGEMYP